MRKTALVLIAPLVLIGACRQNDSREAPVVVTTPSPPADVGEGSAPSARFDVKALELSLQPFLEDFEAPLLFTSSGDGTGGMFVVEQGGRIKVVEPGSTTGEVFLDLSEETQAGGERGLLGLAFHPNYEENRRFFVNYTDRAGDTVVEEYRAEEDGSAADPDSARVLLQIDQPFPNHNGGHLAFGPDGYLYIATGDGGSSGDPHENGQSLETLLGKLLRIDVDRGDPYSIPPGNPFDDGSRGLPEIWAYGLRNPWRFSFDPQAETLWVGDVGQGELEEIDRVAADEAGLNYGWNEMEGSRCFDGACDPTGLVLPITEYGHDEGCSVTGGFVYRGSEFPDMQGAYLFADYCSGSIWAIDSAVTRPVEPDLVYTSERALSSFGQDEAGELYATDIGSGEILKLVDES